MFSSKIASSNPVIMSVGQLTSAIVTTMPMTRPVQKGVVIGEAAGSASKSKVVMGESGSK